MVERELYKFGFVNVIPRHQGQPALPVMTWKQVFVAYTNFLECVFFVEDLGSNALHGIETSFGYMKLSFRISHLYMLHRPVGDCPRPLKQEVVDYIADEKTGKM